MPFVDDLPSKGEIFSFWKNRLAKIGFFVDWGEPGCWACGFHYEDKYDLRDSSASWAKVLRCWERIPLQRCHIVPRSLGGSNKVSNLFLMCRECHDLAPNTTSRKIFFDWAKSQEFWRREIAKMNTALDSFGVEGTAMDGLSDLMRSKRFRAWAYKRSGRHWPQSGYAPKSSRITYSTMIGLAISYQGRHCSKRVTLEKS